MSSENLWSYVACCTNEYSKKKEEEKEEKEKNATILAIYHRTLLVTMGNHVFTEQYMYLVLKVDL